MDYFKINGKEGFRIPLSEMVKLPKNVSDTLLINFSNDNF